MDGVDVDAVAAAVHGCPGVSALSSGRLGDVASYLPGRRVPGVVVEPDSVTVQVRSRWGVPAADLLAQITTALTVLRHGRPLHVVVAEMDDPPDETALPDNPVLTDDPVSSEPAAPDAPVPPTAAAPYPPTLGNVSI